MRKTAIIAAFTACLSLPLSAQESTVLEDGTPVRPDDADKLAMFSTHFTGALRVAFAQGQSGDIADLVDSLSGAAMPADDAIEALQGDWKCQTIKAGELSALVVYAPFDCRIEGNIFEKSTGSQRTRGAIHRDSGRLIYLGTGFVQGSEVPAYADLPTDPLSSPNPGQIWSDIALVEAVTPNRARLIFPDPALESQMNVLYLTR
ncbi:DUF4893 domain-containing protein [Paracoccus aerodenitrificans]|uniref:DUF4893 domain-containing protein n=1 Tax=Paracoccus aerodenitrificans TaxID=3017781 RepID=UPI0022F09871|nr:DUF4893 domain-containing protein [Paracoccus aerodenitrificans]WBU62727.1 DUF4893 domain-containing protein [Paracoccus aerodenitrificans]